MSEGAKTLTFVGVAVGLLIVAVATQPRTSTPAQVVRVGDVLNEVEDPLSATRLQVIKFDEDTSSISKFEVAKIDGLWVIPSHQNYPADAEQHMADAALSVMNLQILGVKTTNPAEDATYGVIEPDIKKLKPGTVGVGSRVTMQNEAGEKLVNMIIGKEVKGQSDQRYVREVGRDPVYVVKLDPAKLTTRFEDWIEKDLLKINPYDIAAVTLKDYSVALGIGAAGLQVQWDRRSEMTFAYNDKDAKWTAADLKVFNPQKQAFDAVTLAADEEVNSEKLNDMKNALDDLKIVDVERKPEGLSQDLKAGKDFATDRKAVQNLAERGFMPVQVGPDAFEVLSTDGEALCQMKDGVEYVLRFGKIVLGSQGDQQKSSADKQGDPTKPDDADKTGSEINRYIFVTTRFNQDAIERPKTEPLPDLPAGAAAKKKTTEPKPESGQDKPAAATATPEPETKLESQPGAAKAPETPKAGTTSGSDGSAPSDQGDAGSSDPPQSGADHRAKIATRVVPTAYQVNDGDADAADATKETGADTAATQDGTAAGDQPVDAKADDQTADSGNAADANAGKEASPDTQSPDTQAADAKQQTESAAAPAAAASGAKQGQSGADKEQSDLDALIARRKEIEKENQRKLDEYNDKIKKGKERVTELNQRFGDWYYVISDTVFQKIHLNRDDVIKKKEEKKEQTDAGGGDQTKPIVPAGPTGALEQLQKGLDQQPAAKQESPAAAAADGSQGEADTTDASPNADQAAADAADQAGQQEAAGKDAAAKEKKAAATAAGDSGDGPDLNQPGK